MKKNFREITFKELVDSIIKESVEEIDGFEAEVETEEPETDTDEFDVSDFEETEDDVKEEGDVTLTLTLDEITTLRSIMAKIDAATEEEPEEETETEEESYDEEIEDTEEVEDEADIPVPSEEEETVVVSKGETGVTLNNKGVNRKKGAPAVNRAGAHKEGAMGTPRAAGDADTVELSNVGVNRKKGAPAVNRQGKHTPTRIAPDKVVIEIGK